MLKGQLMWNSQLLGADLAGDVTTLKARLSGDLISYGCGELAHYLARRGLVNEVRFWLHPVVWGEGVRPFHGPKLPIRMRLVSTTTYTSGVVKLSYQPRSEAVR